MFIILLHLFVRFKYVYISVSVRMPWMLILFNMGGAQWGSPPVDLLKKKVPVPLRSSASSARWFYSTGVHLLLHHQTMRPGNFWETALRSGAAAKMAGSKQQGHVFLLMLLLVCLIMKMGGIKQTVTPDSRMESSAEQERASEVHFALFSILL